MATQATDKKVTKISERRALNSAGEDQADYTEAQIAEYEHIKSGAKARFDYRPAIDAMIAGGFDKTLAKVVAAFAIEGFITKAGHAVNKATKGTNPTHDVPRALREFMDNALDGGWTNREGGQEVNAAAIMQAYAEYLASLPNATESAEQLLPRVKLGWEGGQKADGTVVQPWPEAKKIGIRSHPQVKANVLAARARKAQAEADKAPAPDLPSIDEL